MDSRGGTPQWPSLSGCRLPCHWLLDGGEPSRGPGRLWPAICWLWQPVTVCPYLAGDLLRSAWVRGYAKARPLPSSTDN
ncbi:Rmf/CrpP fold protein [Streptomyces sp. NPDC056656]|uniref:Rmf/CrpP fold protein n=1 Tax=Streptomyces sp. NPDC056656 TaxID=3345895 RepID=UPI0036B15E8D